MAIKRRNADHSEKLRKFLNEMQDFFNFEKERIYECNRTYIELAERMKFQKKNFKIINDFLSALPDAHHNLL